MKKTLQYFCFFSLCCLLAFNSEAQSRDTRTLSYSQLFAEMSASKVDFVLTNAKIEFNPNTDQRFLEADSLQLEQFDTIRITCKVFLDKVFFQNTSDTLIKETGKFLGDISLQKIVFTDSVKFRDSKIEIPSMKHCTFSWLGFSDCNFPNGFSFNNCSAEADFSFWGCQFKKDVRIQHSKLYGKTELVMLGIPSSILHINNCMLNELSIRWADAGRLIFKENTIKSYFEISNSKIDKQEIYRNKFAPLEMDSSNRFTPLFKCTNVAIDKFSWGKNTFNIKEKYTPCFLFTNCKISDKLDIYSTFFPGPILLADVNITGSFNFGLDCTFKEGVFLQDLFFNERSSIDWSTLENNIRVTDLEGSRKSIIETLDSIQDYGLLERELGNNYYCEEQMKNKRIFQSVFKAQGSSRKANAVMIEIKDLETAMWEHAFLEDNTLNSYFNWKMNTFLKRFSAYGTNPVIAIIYSFKVILIFALFYLFLHNDWDPNSRKKIGKRLTFMLKYLQVDKGLSELDREEQKDAQDSLAQLHADNEASEGKVPIFLRKAIGWHVKSNFLSKSLRNFALRNMDILSGTYSELSKAKRTKVAFLSTTWLLLFLAYTLLVKLLNALTLSLNAFTTLGFGNIPTKGFSRYIVIVQGFIGWVLMTIFSVTLISQLLQ